jgi:hypothetical protein
LPEYIKLINEWLHFINSFFRKLFWQK